ncbi:MULTISPECIES: trypsin-like peptidase domain-containing protein [unclassified Bradyrhizobium]|uniref:trypsin-like peptidase domain-containing protein n=1 Tax=unclassified Bradyrhizobium TaxID=2631580 RepID=UPI0028E641C9|nr:MULTISPECIES: trypsin-like peptidase domain-containing protein [unclassified Bradyrhizobium]
MLPQSSFERFRELVTNGEAFAAAEGIRDLLRGDIAGAALTGSWSNHLNELAVQSARIIRSRKAYRSNVLSRADFERESSAIDSALLEIIDDIERRSVRSAPIKERPVSFLPGALNGLEKIIGPVSQLKSLAWLHRGLACAKSVCRVRTPSGTGSGFLIGNGLLLTNNHVLSTPSDARRSEVDFNFEEDERGVIGDIARYSVDPTSFVTSEELDCTAVKLLQRDGSADLTAWGALELAADAVELEDHVVIIQHPQGGVKQICITENRVVTLLDDHIQYTTDTMPGSSGAPVFNDNWRVIAIHHQGGNLITSARGGRIFANQGVRISSILASSKIGGVLRNSIRQGW